VEADVVPVDERTLEALGIVRLPIPVPFIEAGGPANVYAIANGDRSWTLFDTGIATPEGTAALETQAVERGVDLSRVSRIVVSHGHVDHYGNAQRIAERSGAPVLIHPADRNKVLGHFRYSSEIENNVEYYLRLGVPEPVLLSMLERTKRAPTLARPVDSAILQPLDEGMVFDFQHFSVSVMHLPGHTPGLVCLHSAAQRLLFADDHVLARVSPNPLLDLSLGTGAAKFLSLVSYLKSAERVVQLELDAVLPGHGPAFSGHQRLLRGLFQFYRTRQDKLVAALTIRPRTAFEAIAAIFVKIDLSRLYLLLSEVIANLEVLEVEGRVQRTLQDGVFVFAKA
jgi:glyoxylase-like metal-dependent hydrolase (beta-lactamase superfamily II)